MRALDEGYHVNLKRMYDFLGIGYTTQKFIYSLSKQSAPDGSKRSYFIHSSSNHQLPPPRPADQGIVAWGLQLLYVGVCYFWFTLCCFVVKPRTAPESTADETLRSYLKRIRLPVRFTKDYLLPLMSSVTTCPHEALLDFPAQDATQYASRTYRQPHYTVIGGVQEVQGKLAKDIAVNLQATVKSVAKVGAKTQVTWTDSNGQDHISAFDHVVLAVTPNVVAQIYEPLREMMNMIPVISGESVIHRDTSAIADCSVALNRFFSKRPKARDTVQIMHINTGASSTESTHQQANVFVTNWPLSRLDPDKVMHRAKLMRVLRTPKSRIIINNFFPTNSKDQVLHTDDQNTWLNGNDNVWLVGSWCWDGMVLLEGCVVSAMRVGTALGVEIPWMH